MPAPFAVEAAGTTVLAQGTKAGTGLFLRES